MNSVPAEIEILLFGPKVQKNSIIRKLRRCTLSLLCRLLCSWKTKGMFFLAASQLISCYGGCIEAADRVQSSDSITNHKDTTTMSSGLDSKSSLWLSISKKIQYSKYIMVKWSSCNQVSLVLIFIRPCGFSGFGSLGSSWNAKYSFCKNVWIHLCK